MTRDILPVIFKIVDSIDDQGHKLRYFFPEKCIGRIVTITSGLVCGGAPSRSPYVFTKYAAVGFLECLRYEMRRFGVHVSKFFNLPNIFCTCADLYCKIFSFFA